MYNKLVSFVFIGGTAICQGQVILTQSDLPKIGDVQISVRIDSTQGISLVPGSAGPNVVWDFSNLQHCCGNSSYDTITWTDPKKTSKSSFFPLANIAQKKDCYSYHSHVTHTEAQECYNNYYIQDNSGLLWYGFNNANGENILSIYHNMFPLLSYGDSVNNKARIVFTLSKDSTRVSYIIGTSVADAWGTLITPDTTVNAVRIYTSEKNYDSLFVKGVGQQINVQSGNYYYRWYAKNIGFPVLQISKENLHQKSDYQQVRFAATRISGTTAINEYTENNDKLLVAPNPFSVSTTFYFGKEKKESVQNYSMRLYDVLGREVRTIENITEDKIVISREHLTTGIYFYELAAENRIVSRGKLMVN